ncbi:hypothetical protein [Phenylobacterium sp.]|uniref:hypothetical protein n=1 Tax=Phenylobacterium sp. TaxID=1871053 RepID=UPI00391A5127
MRGYRTAAALWFASVIALAMLIAFPSKKDLSDFWAAAFLGVIFGYFAATDWLTIQLGRRSASGQVRWRRVAVLVLGAPTAVWALGLTAFIAYNGDNAWMALHLALIPALAVWPFTTWALKNLQALERATD